MIQTLMRWVHDTQYAVTMRDSLWAYPITEILHLIGVMALFGSILLVDLRFIGVGRKMSASRLSADFLLRVTWAAFALIVMSGLSLFAAYAGDTIRSPIFLTKITLIAAAGLNMGFFTFRVNTDMARWDLGLPSPRAARLSAALSIVLWTLTICAGRLIAYPEMFGITN
jgi:hypothetical protein